jgi:hypothetical protein
MFSSFIRMLVTHKKEGFLHSMLNPEVPTSKDTCACRGTWFDHNNVSHSDRLCSKSSFAS